MISLKYCQHLPSKDPDFCSGKCVILKRKKHTFNCLSPKIMFMTLRTHIKRRMDYCLKYFFPFRPRVRSPNKYLGRLVYWIVGSMKARLSKSYDIHNGYSSLSSLLLGRNSIVQALVSWISGWRDSSGYQGQVAVAQFPSEAAQ